MDINRRVLLTGGAALAAWPCLAAAAQPNDVAPQRVPEGAIILTATITAKPGEEEAVKKALLTMVEPTRKEPGCLCYNLHQSKADKARFMFYEQWASKEAFDAHGKTEHMKALGPQLEGRVEPAEVFFFDLLG